MVKVYEIVWAMHQTLVGSAPDDLYFRKDVKLMPRKIKMSEWAFQPAGDGQFEQWFDIPGFEGKYEMTVKDRIRNKKTKEEIKPRENKRSMEVKLYGRDGKRHTRSVSSLHKETFDPERIKWLWKFMNPDPDKPAYEGKHYLYHVKK